MVAYDINFKALKTAVEQGHCLCNLSKKCPCEGFISRQKCTCGVFKKHKDCYEAGEDGFPIPY